MKLLFKTTDEREAHKFEAEAQRKYGGMAVYRFQYQSTMMAISIMKSC